MSAPTEREQAIRTLGERLHGLGVAMLTTLEPDGALRSRPMVAHPAGFDGDLWFLARNHSRTVWSVQRFPRVNLTFADTGRGRFVSVTGTAHVVQNRRKAEELWDPSLRAWLAGVDDPELCLIKVTVESAQAWGGPSGAAERIEGFVVKA